VTNPRHTDTSVMLAGISLRQGFRLRWRYGGQAGGKGNVAVMNGGSVVMNGGSRAIPAHGRLDRHRHCL